MPVAYGPGLWVKSWDKTFVDRDGGIWKMTSLTQTENKVHEIFELVQKGTKRQKISDAQTDDAAKNNQNEGTTQEKDTVQPEKRPKAEDGLT